MEDLLLKTASGRNFETELDAVIQVYASDFDIPLLKMQLEVLQTKLKEKRSSSISISVVKEYIINLGTAKSLLTEVVKLVKLILVNLLLMPLAKNLSQHFERLKLFSGAL